MKYTKYTKYKMQNVGYKKKSKKYKKYKNKAKGSKKSFKDKKVIISQLSQLNIPHDLRQETLKNFSASVIQDRFNEKNINRIKKLLNIMTETQVKKSMDLFKEKIYEIDLQYNFNDNKIPTYLINIKNKLKIAMADCATILAYKISDEFIKNIEKTPDSNISSFMNNI